MNIAIDFDGTITLNPNAFADVISVLRKHGFNVFIVTMRYLTEREEVDLFLERSGVKVDAVFFTGRRAKRDYMNAQGIKIDIWVDDQPDFILYGALLA